MNQSAYMQALWKRVGKIGNAGQGFLDTGVLDSAFGGAEARRQLMLQRIGDQKAAGDRRLDLYQKGLGYQGQRQTRDLDLREDVIDAQSKDALMGDVITGATLPISYIEGQNQRKAIDADRARQDKTNEGLSTLIRRYDSLLGRLS